MADAKPGLINTAEELVTKRFDQIDGWLEKYERQWNTALYSLRNIFSDSNFPEKMGQIEETINYEFVDSAPPDFEMPPMPKAPSSSYGLPGIPGKIGEFQTVTIQSLDEFRESLDDVDAPGIDFMERLYRSGVLDDLKSNLRDILNNGGTGLGATVEQQIWNRARARKDLDNERVYREAETYFAARGFTLPPGALAGRLFEALQEQTRADNQLSAEIGIEQARLAQSEMQNVRQVAAQLEQITQDTHNRIQQRAYEKARDAAAAIQKAYEVKVAAFQAKVDAHRTNAETEKIKAEAAASNNRSIADVYRADVDAYKAQIQAELGIVETQGQIFAAQISGFSAEADAKAKKMTSQIEQYKARIQQSNNQTALAIQEAETLLAKYLEGLRLDSDVESAHTQILTQVVASLYNAVSVSGSLSEGLNYRKSLNDEGDPDVSVHYNFSDK